MATQSLYRRYRPRRFSELRGQDHVVRALRNAVAGHREGHAYLFSGPRGTGKTSSARILAKVLNCAAPVDGEPCCECESCLAVEAGNSYDVFELDAASNNGVDSMRDLIEKASLGTPGRQKVYILDEVHMLSKAAEAALLKTLEEPPSHVVFVLATTDPQKVSETIRSRTQHLQFHLLPMDELEAHVRWVAADAGIHLDDDALQSVLDQGGGSARDTLSALELVAVSGGMVEVAPRIDDLLDALADQDTGLALATIAHAVQQGRDARSLADEVVRTLREAFLTLMAPELVQVPTARADSLAEQARRVGAPLLVRAMEVLGEVLIEMRHAPDPRLLVEVAMVKLTNAEIDPGVSSLLTRVKHLEDLVAKGALAAPERPVEVDPGTGRAKLGSRARADASGPIERPAAGPPSAAAAAAPPPSPAPSGSPPSAAATEQVPSGGLGRSAEQAPSTTPVPPSAGSRPSAEPASAPAPRHGSVERATAGWSNEVLPALKPLVRALYAAGHLQGEQDGSLVVAVPNEPHRQRAEQHRAEVEQVLSTVAGGTLRILLVVEGAAPAAASGPSSTTRASDSSLERGSEPPADHSKGSEADDELPELVDLDDLADAPPVGRESSIDRLAKAFPGAQLIEEQD